MLCFDTLLLPCAHIRISQLVTSLQARCQQVVFAWLVASYQGLWQKLLQLVTTLLILSDLLQGYLNCVWSILAQLILNMNSKICNRSAKIFKNSAKICNNRRINQILRWKWWVKCENKQIWRVKFESICGQIWLVF